jgi:hypothetical protein
MLATRGIFSPFYYGCATGHDITAPAKEPVGPNETFFVTTFYSIAAINPLGSVALTGLLPT